MKKNILKILLILLLGGLGGILANALILPYLATIPPFSNIGFIKQIKDGTVIINKTEVKYITENAALIEAIDKINPCLVDVEAYYNDKLLAQGSGFIMTNDGWIVTASDLVPTNANKYMVYRNGDSFIVESVKRDTKNGLALLKINQSNLSVVSMAELEDVHIGEQMILIGIKRTKGVLYKFANPGTVRSINQGVLEVNIREYDYQANGGPMINIKGEVIGLNLIDKNGLKKTVPSKVIKDFLNVL